MPVNRTDIDRTFDANGNLIREEVVERDITTEANRATIEQRVAAALAANNAYLANAAPSVVQNTNQVKALTRQMNGLIRILTNRLDSAD